jgi:chromosome segregation ATPase
MILGDNRGQLKQLEDALVALDAERRRYGEDKKALEDAAAKASFDMMKAGNRAQQLERQISGLKSELQVLENERSSLASLSFQTFEEDKRRSLETLAMLKAQMANLFAQRQAADQRIAALSAELEENGRQQAAIKDETEGVLEAMAQESAFRRDADKDLRTLEASRAYEETEVSTLGNRVAAIETELASMVGTALTIGPRTETSKAVTVLSKELKRLTAALEEMAKNQPDPAQLAAELDAARAAFERSRAVVRAEEQMIDKLTSTVVKRQEMWRIWRAGIIKRSMVEFILMLAARDFQGNLTYDNEAGELTIRVRPKAQVLSDKLHRQQSRDDNEEEAAGEEERDVRQLSGGEKSYSTSCFLFSLWSSMAAPLRCLDEFDVFMDNVNRDYVIQELVKCARSSGVQFILITPNAIWNSIKMDCDIKVIRLADPDRQQGVLA